MHQQFLLIAGTASLALSLPVTALAQPALRQGMPYAEARTLLLDAGWQAQAVANPEQDETMAYLIELGYGEVVACSGTGRGFCAFEFIDADGRKLSVSTVNNQRGEQPTLYRWWLEQNTP